MIRHNNTEEELLVAYYLYAYDVLKDIKQNK